jgi:spore germination protein GerM
MPIPPSDNNLSNQDKAPTRTSPRAPWVLILPLALAAGVLLQQSQNTDNANVTFNNVPTSVQSPTPTSDNLRGKPATYALFVPDDNGDLRRETVVDRNYFISADALAEDFKKVRAETATRAIQILMKRHPDDFPKGAQLNAATIDDNDVTVLDFNKSFSDSTFWQGETRTLASSYALVNTAIESQKSATGEKGKGEVQFLIEGKPLQNLGELDTQSPLKTDLKMVASTPKNVVNAR